MNIYYKLKGGVRYFGYVLESILKVVSSFIYQVILLAQKAAVRYFSKSHVYLKQNDIRLHNWAIASLLNFKCGFNITNLFIDESLKSEGLKKNRICNSLAGNTYGILYMCTSYKCWFVAGET